MSGLRNLISLEADIVPDVATSLKTIAQEPKQTQPLAPDFLFTYSDGPPWFETRLSVQGPNKK